MVNKPSPPSQPIEKATLFPPFLCSRFDGAGVSDREFWNRSQLAVVMSVAYAAQRRLQKPEVADSRKAAELPNLQSM